MTDVTPTTDPAATPTPALVASVESFSREYVEGIRNEAAAARVAKNEAVTNAKAAADQEWATKVQGVEAKTSALEADLGDAWVYAEKVQQAIDAHVPSDKLVAFVEFVKGSDKASIAASVESAKALFGGFGTAVPATDPTQGSGGVPSHGLNSDDLLNSVKTKLGIQ